MKILRNANPSRIAIIGYQEPEPGVVYVPNPCLIREGSAMFNPLTEEAAVVEDIAKDRRGLVRGWYLVPKGLDIVSMAHMIRQRQLANMAKPRGITGYTIFTTTACNAKCAYCFERDYDVLTMSDEKAHQVADYIVKTCNKSTQIKIKWFGGEPLVNKAAINIICAHLREYGINFVSDITTNGDLLPKCTDAELKLWRLRWAQLTIDDVGAEYDRIKGIPGAYDRLHSTVARLIALGIRTTIRIHYHPEKGAEACLRVADDMAKHQGVRMYCRILYGNETPKDYENVMAVEDYLHKCGVWNPKFPVYSSGSHCMADRQIHACITPTGELSPCEHYAYGEHIYGNIATKNRNGTILAKWRQKEKHTRDSCRDCPLYACCEKNVMCPGEGHCANGYADFLIERIRRALRYTATHHQDIIKGASKEELAAMGGIC